MRGLFCVGNTKKQDMRARDRFSSFAAKTKRTRREGDWFDPIVDSDEESEHEVDPRVYDIFTQPNDDDAQVYASPQVVFVNPPSQQSLSLPPKDKEEEDYCSPTQPADESDESDESEEPW